MRITEITLEPDDKIRIVAHTTGQVDIDIVAPDPGHQGPPPPPLGITAAEYYASGGVVPGDPQWETGNDNPPIPGDYTWQVNDFGVTVWGPAPG